jgi:hypothetical protein
MAALGFWAATVSTKRSTTRQRACRAGRQRRDPFLHGAPSGHGLAGAGYLLHHRPMQRRFESDPLLQSTLLVLQERSPQLGAFYSNTTEQAALRSNVAEQRCRCAY